MSTSVETVAPEVTAPPPARPTLLPLVRRLHFYAGVLVAPLLVIAAVTGLLYAFTPQWDELAYGEQLHVARVGDHPLPLTDQVRAAQSEVPGGTLHSVRPGEHPDDTTRIAFTVAGLEDQQRTVFVDPYTGQSRGVLTTTSGATPVTSWLSELHRSLHLGEPGRLYSETAASWLWVLALGGLTLWLSRRLRRPAVLTPKRGRAADATPERGRMLPGRRAVGGVRRTRGWHATTGIWLLTFLLVLSATGLTWSGYAGGRFEAALEALDARSPDRQS